MRALTLTQPWATLVAIGAKTIETRDWGTNYRGELLITAAKKFPQDCRELSVTSPFNETLGVETLHTGKAVAVVDLIASFPFTQTTAEYVRRRSAKGILPLHEGDFGDYGVDRFGFLFDNIRRLPAPIPVRGMLGIWTVPAEIERAIREQLAVAA